VIVLVLVRESMMSTRRVRHAESKDLLGIFSLKKFNSASKILCQTLLALIAQFKKKMKLTSISVVL
jgi:hypothetical protein